MDWSRPATAPEAGGTLVLLGTVPAIVPATRQNSVRQRGSHLRIECGKCVTTVPVHAGEDIGPGLLRRIERDLEPCLGKGWLKKP
jgi:HicA toxin of bacterial toxin-antitoxin,